MPLTRQFRSQVSDNANAELLVAARQPCGLKALATVLHCDCMVPVLCRYAID